MLSGALFLGVALRALVLLSPGIRDQLSRAPELTTPVSSIRRVEEAVALVRMGASPYASDLFHQPPLVIAALWPFFDTSEVGLRLSGLPLRVMYILADILTALAIRGLARRMLRGDARKGAALVGSTTTAEPALPAKYFQLDVLKNKGMVPDMCAALYLVLPFSVLTCTALDTSVLVRTATAGGLFFASKSKSLAAAFCIALAGYVEMRPIVFLVGAAAIDTHLNSSAANGRHTLQETRREGGSSGTGQRQIMEKKRGENECGVTSTSSSPSSGSFVHSLLRYAAGVLMWSAVFHLLSSMLFSSPHPNQQQQQAASRDETHTFTSSFEYIRDSYVWQLKFPDHKPNVGLYWYFFSMVFDRFRPYFLFAFNIHPLLYVVPLTLRAWRRPLVLTTILVALSGMLRPYPTIGDMALPCSLGLMCPEVVARMRIKTILIVTMCVCMCLLPTMWFLWIFPGAGNANHYYFSSVTYLLCGLMLVSEFLGGAIQQDRERSKSEDAVTESRES
eukprot:g4930.t1